MRRKFLVITLAVALGLAVTPQNSTAIQVPPPIKSCLTKKYGASVASAIAKAKVLNATQKKQMTACSSSSTPASGSTTASPSTSGLTTMSYGLLWSVGSNQAGLGNVSDPALVQLANGTLRMFFKNGNEPQIPLSGFDNKIHSYVSSDNGKTWTLESGVRIDISAPVTVRTAESGGYEAWGWTPGSGGVDNFTRFTSSTGMDFTKGSGSAVPTSGCKNKDGASAGFLGDAQVVKVAGGYLAFAHDLAAGKNPPFKRQACKLTSTDGNSWSIDASGTFAFDYDIQNNPELFRNASGQLELWFSADRGMTKTSEIRTSTNDGASWSSATSLSWMANDPDRLDLSNGDSLLAFGNFDQRKGGLLAVAKRISSTYNASRDEKVDQVTWTVSGAKQTDITVKNLCLGTDLTSRATITTSGSNLTVSLKDSSVGCAYILVGAAQAIS